MQITEQEQATMPASKTHAVEFHGKAEEYFRIWIVNLVLSIVTLGVYSAWASVRTRRYFLGNTIIDGSSFDYHAEPTAILRGRLVAIAVLLLYSFGDFIHIMVIPVTVMVVAIIFPWLYRSALRFRRNMTSYRNVRFGFVGTTQAAYMAFLPACIYIVMFLMVLILPTLNEQAAGLVSVVVLLFALVSLFLFPILSYLTHRYAVENTLFGRQKFSTAITAGDFFVIFIVVLGIGFLFGLLAFLGTAWISFSGGGGVLSITVLLLFLYMLYGSALSLINAYWVSKIRNLIADKSQLDTLKFHSNMDFGAYWKIVLTNMLAVIFSLGFAYPWARVRIAKYHAETLRLEGDLDQFVSGQAIETNALGDEVADMLDIDVGF